MKKFDLVIIGAHNGSGLEELILEQKNKVLLIEPVNYNLQSLKNRFKNINNIFFENVGVSDEKKQIKFYYVKESSVKKLGKEWGTGIGSFKKKHLLDHHRKRFKIIESDIEEVNVKIVVFNDLVEKYNISEIEYLFIDTEGYDYQIIKSIDFNKTKINKVKFEYKHLDDTFKFDLRLLELREMFNQLNYKEIDIDSENITFKKIAI
jgi:FkbM family methyltransferase